MATSPDHVPAEDRDLERLPWLETVEEDEPAGPSIVRIALIVLAALVVLAGAILGYRYLRAPHGTDGHGALIAAQEGDYKVKPDDPGGTKVDGEGDTAIATSNGTSAASAIDLKALPEKPVAGKKAAPAAPAKGGSKAVMPIPGKTAGAAGGSLVQLGSFPDAAAAEAAWGTLSKRLAFLAPLGKSVQAAEVGGRTVYRLRVNAGSAQQAVAVCGKVKAAGAACFVPRA